MILSHFNSFSFEMEKDTADCRAFNCSFFIVGSINKTGTTKNVSFLWSLFLFHRRVLNNCRSSFLMVAFIEVDLIGGQVLQKVPLGRVEGDLAFGYDLDGADGGARQINGQNVSRFDGTFQRDP